MKVAAFILNQEVKLKFNFLVFLELGTIKREYKLNSSYKSTLI